MSMGSEAASTGSEQLRPNPKVSHRAIGTRQKNRTRKMAKARVVVRVYMILNLPVLL